MHIVQKRNVLSSVLSMLGMRISVGRFWFLVDFGSGYGGHLSSMYLGLGYV